MHFSSVARNNCLVISSNWPTLANLATGGGSGGSDTVIMASMMAEPGNLADRPAGEVSVRGLLEHGCSLLAERSDSARLDAELLLAHAWQRQRSYLHSHAEAPVAAAVAAEFRALLARRAQGEPLAYLTGQREFWSLPLQVTAAVLALRPQPSAAVAELGTGSGAIALALATERPQWRIVATDLDGAALGVARLNAERLRLRNIEFLQGHWLAPLCGRHFDLIASNPPYVAASDPALHALRYEPAAALSAGPSGLEALRHIALAARAHMRHGGWLVLEHGAQQGGDVAQALVAAGYARVGCRCDLAGRERVTEALWP